MIIQHLIKEFDAYLIAISTLIPVLISIKISLKKFFGIELKTKKRRDEDKLKTDSRKITLKNQEDIKVLKKDIKEIKNCVNNINEALAVYIKNNGVDKKVKKITIDILNKNKKK